MNFGVSVADRVKINENEKIEKYLDLERELKIWNMRVTLISLEVGALGTFPKGREKIQEDL